jgi:hypothetical protein
MICVERVCLDQLPERVPILANSLTPVNPVPLKVNIWGSRNQSYRARNNHSPRHRHRNKPQRHQSNRNAHMPITHTFMHHLGTIREQCCIGRTIPVAWKSQLWFGSGIIVCITKHKMGRLVVGGGVSDPLLL